MINVWAIYAEKYCRNYVKKPQNIFEKPQYYWTLKLLLIYYVIVIIKYQVKLFNLLSYVFIKNAQTRDFKEN